MEDSVSTKFVSMVSHELRTPLNSVQGFIDLLMHGQVGELTAEQYLYLGYAQEGVQQLISIVEDIVFIARADAGEFSLKQEEVQLHTLATQVISNLQRQALKAGVTLCQDIPSSLPVLYVDPQRMKRVLDNLVINALKFTASGGIVTLNAHPYNEHFLRISVSDTGYGIAAEDRPYVFERFYQSNSDSQSGMGGWGLGLAIAKLIVERHGGSIGFDTALDRGTTFYFTVPVVVHAMHYP